MKGFYRTKYTTPGGETRHAAVTQFEVCGWSMCVWSHVVGRWWSCDQYSLYWHHYWHNESYLQIKTYRYKTRNCQVWRGNYVLCELLLKHYNIITTFRIVQTTSLLVIGCKYCDIGIKLWQTKKAKRIVWYVWCRIALLVCQCIHACLSVSNYPA